MDSGQHFSVTLELVEAMKMSRVQATSGQWYKYLYPFGSQKYQPTTTPPPSPCMEDISEAGHFRGGCVQIALQLGTLQSKLTW